MTAALNLHSERTLIDELLAEQGRLTAVERFSRKHERGAAPSQARFYRDLIPLSKPAPGEQYAFAVDLDACTGCKACVSACHSLNGLDEDEMWRSVGMIHGGGSADSYQQTVTTACHHCVEPACMEGCPVGAYEKDAETGIVRHLDDQCIGCQYCVLKCPYDVPKYSEKRGIVRKCDMCANRLAVGEAPACVQACPTHAIRITLVDKEEVSRAAKPPATLVPGAFTSDYTQPTTRYRTRRAMPADTRAGDAHRLRSEHAHWPLIGMLVLTQMAVGLFLALALLPLAGEAALAKAKLPLALVGFAILNAGLAVSVLHLGRPLGAWRFFLGLRTSWMSREILAFSLFAATAGGCVAVSGAPWIEAQTARWIGSGSLLAQAFGILRSHAVFMPLSIGTAALGLASVFCSAMIYVDTRRAFWAGGLTVPKFFGTTVLLGAAGAACSLAWTHRFTGGFGAAMAAVAITAAAIHAILVGWEARNLFTSLQDSAAAAHRSARVMWELCKPLVLARAALFLGALFAALLTVADAARAAEWATFSFALTAASLTVERFLFFTAVEAPRMPGVG